MINMYEHFMETQQIIEKVIKFQSHFPLDNFFENKFDKPNGCAYICNRMVYYIK